MIEIKDLAFSYGKVQILNNISMTLEDGKIYGLLGENGVGKTTLLTLLAGLKNTQAGTILSDGKQPCKREPDFLASQFFLSDELSPVNSKASKWAVAEGKFWPKFDYSQFCHIMEEFSLDIDMKMNEMSLGQLKKTYIAFALSCNTKVILMDEPTNGLDIPSKALFRSAIMKYTSDDTIIVISTHQVRDLENIIDPIVILDRQEVLLNASLSEITEKLYFDYGTELSGDSLYCEQLPGSFIQVRQNTSGEESKVNVEALFNAVLKNKELIKTLFAK